MAVFNVPLSKSDRTNQSPDYRDLLPTPPLPGDVPSCAEGGVLGILPGTMGCIQATEAIKYILTSGISRRRLTDKLVIAFYNYAQKSE